MNGKQLIEIAKRSETAKRVMRMLIERQRNTVYTAFSGLRADLKKRDGKPVDRKDFDRVFKDLQAIGAGKVDQTTRGVFKGFTWTVPVRELTELLRQNKKEEKAESATISQSEAEKKVTVILLRRNRKPETIEADEATIRKLTEKPYEVTPQN